MICFYNHSLESWWTIGYFDYVHIFRSNLSSVFSYLCSASWIALRATVFISILYSFSRSKSNNNFYFFLFPFKIHTNNISLADTKIKKMKILFRSLCYRFCYRFGFFFVAKRIFVLIEIQLISISFHLSFFSMPL